MKNDRLMGAYCVLAILPFFARLRLCSFANLTFCDGTSHDPHARIVTIAYMIPSASIFSIVQDSDRTVLPLSCLAAYDITGYGPDAAFNWFDYRPEETAWPGFLDQMSHSLPVRNHGQKVESVL